MSQTKKYSEAQLRMLEDVERAGYSESPSGMGRHSGRAASAWHRTAQSLVDRGLLVFVRWGDHYRVRTPDPKREALVGALEAGR